VASLVTAKAELALYVLRRTVPLAEEAPGKDHPNDRGNDYFLD
jgi:hypothetical protein